jgi:DNA-binding NarL/FixJ family response regulator
MPKTEGTERFGLIVGARESSIMIELLLLEPDFWRFTGIQHIAERSGQVHLLGERHFEKVLALKRAPAGVSPAITMLAHRLIRDHGIALIPYLRDIFRGTSVIVFGEDDRLELTAEMLAVGASGYFLMSTPANYLSDALKVIGEGRIWAPREAVALSAHCSKPKGSTSALLHAAIDERNLLDLLYEGLSNKEMAARLGLAEVTIKARMSRLYRKYGVKTRVQLLATAMRRDLFSPAWSGRPDAGNDQATLPREA